LGENLKQALATTVRQDALDKLSTDFVQLQKTIGEIDTRLSDSMTALEANSSTSGSDGSGGQVTAAQVAQIRTQLRTDMTAAFAERMDVLASELEAVRASTEKELTSIAAAVAKLQVEADSAIAVQAALSDALDQLSTATRTGAPFAGPLMTLTDVGVRHPLLPTLSKFADGGLASNVELITALQILLLEPVAQIEPAQTPVTWQQRLLQGAQSLIQVTPVSEVEKREIRGKMDLVRQFIEQQNWTEALASWQTLPDDLQVAGQAVAEQLTIYAQAPQMIDDIGNQLAVGLTTSGAETAQCSGFCYFWRSFLLSPQVLPGWRTDLAPWRWSGRAT
jgi:hypothetical protein